MTLFFRKRMGVVRVSPYTQMRNGKRVKINGYERSAVEGNGTLGEEESQNGQEILNGGWFEDVSRIVETYGPGAVSLLGTLLLTQKPEPRSVSSPRLSSYPSGLMRGGEYGNGTSSLVRSHDVGGQRQPTEQDLIQLMLSQIEEADQKEDVNKYKPFFREKDYVDVLGIEHDLSKVNSPYSRIMAGEMPWLEFDGKYLRWYVGQMAWWEWPAVSGNGKYRSDRSRPSVTDQKVVSMGPIPAGYYSVSQSNYQEINKLPLDNYICSHIPSALKKCGRWPGGVMAWGEQRVWVHPVQPQKAYGRTNFSIHGGWFKGSAGCIDLTEAMPDFAHKFRSYGDDMLLVVLYR